LLKPQALDSGVFFKDVQTIHQTEPVNAGKAYIYFFPNGYVENSVINFRNEDDDVNYGLEIKGLTGAVAIHPEYVQLKPLEEETK
jgi:general secretion pathway protein H